MRQDRFDYSLHFKLSLVSSYRPLAIQAPLVRDVSGSYALRDFENKRKKGKYINNAIIKQT